MNNNVINKKVEIVIEEHIITVKLIIKQHYLIINIFDNQYIVC